MHIRIARSGMSALSTTAVALTASALLAACSGHGGGAANSVLPPTQNQGASDSHSVAVTKFYGGGSTLASLLYRQWEDYYGVAMPPDPQGAPNGLPVNGQFQYFYAGIGSGSAQVAFLTQTPSTTAPQPNPIFCPNAVNTCYPYPRWDYSGSDATLSAAQISCYQIGCPGPPVIQAVQPVRGQYVQIPTLATDITMAYNPNGQTVPSGGLQLSRNSYCGIWEGAITNWGDPGITADNNGVQVSTQSITRVVRSDGSGTTFLLTNHLNTVCQNLSNPNFDWTGGVGTTVTWPGTTLPESGSGGIVSGVTNTPGGIGYVGPSFVAPVVPGGLPTSRVQNQYSIDHNVRQFVGPTVASTLAAVKSITPPTNPDPLDLGILFPDPIANHAYPVVGFTWVEAYECYRLQPQTHALTDLIDWYAKAGVTGTSPADQLLQAQGLAPLSAPFKGRVRTIANAIVKGPVANVCTI